MKSLSQVDHHVWNQVMDQVWNQVMNQVGDQVNDRVRGNSIKLSHER